MRILVVCIGNLCRSPLAERLLQQRLDAARLGFAEVTSAGTRACDGQEMEPHAADQLTRLGGEPATFRSRRLTPELLSGVDLTLTATKDLRTEVLSLAPRLMKRVFTLGEFADILEAQPAPAAGGLAPDELVARAAARRPDGRNGLDVADPIGRSVETHRAVADQLEALVDRLAPHLLLARD